MVDLKSGIMVVFNRKGGVGKTVTCCHLATVAALAGRKVLVIDYDPQGDSTNILGGNERKYFDGEEYSEYREDKSTLQPDVTKWLFDEKSFDDTVIHTNFGVDLIPNFNSVESRDFITWYDDDNSTLMNRQAFSDAIQKSLDEFCYRKRRDFEMQFDKDDVISDSDKYTSMWLNTLKNRIGELKDKYDLILIDCNPTYSNWNRMAFSAADHLLVTMGPDAFSLNGLGTVYEDYLLAKAYNNQLNFAGIAIVNMPYNSKVAKYNYSLMMNSGFKVNIINTVVRQDAKIQKAVQNCRPVYYDLGNVKNKLTRAGSDYINLARDLKLIDNKQYKTFIENGFAEKAVWTNN